MKEPWSIKTRSKTCAASEEAFEDGEKIRAAIFPDPESSGYLRKDYKVEAWEKSEDDEAPFSTWLTTYTPPVIEEKPEAVVQDDPETLLGKLIEEDEAHTENARYILAVMLERKKLLRETDTQELPTGKLRVYEQRKSGDIYIIKDPQIPLSDVDKVQEEVRALLDPQPEPKPGEETESETSLRENGEPDTPSEPEETSEAGSDENPETEGTTQSEVKTSDDNSTEDESDSEEDESAPLKEK